MIDNKLKQFANEYISDVNIVCQMMLKAHNLTSLRDIKKIREMQGKGSFHLNGENNYTFHGRGCRFSNDKIKIDWDFEYNDDILCGLDPWKLFYYIKYNKTSNEFSDGSQIKEIFDKLVADEKMIKKFDLYYY